MHGIRLVGLFVGLLGVVLLLGIDVAGDTDELLGALCVLGATLGYAAGPMLAAKTLADLPPIAPVTGALAVSTVALLPLAIIDPPGGGVPFKAWGSVIVLGIACTAVALVVFFVLLTEAGPSRASVITYINPVVAVALGVAFLNESLGAGSLLGLALILSGSYVSTLGSSRAREGVRPRRAPRGAPRRAAQLLVLDRRLSCCSERRRWPRTVGAATLLGDPAEEARARDAVGEPELDVGAVRPALAQAPAAALVDAGDAGPRHVARARRTRRPRRARRPRPSRRASASGSARRSRARLVAARPPSA